MQTNKNIVGTTFKLKWEIVVLQNLLENNHPPINMCSEQNFHFCKAWFPLRVNM